jgi:hypothetical protein
MSRQSPGEDLAIILNCTGLNKKFVFFETSRAAEEPRVEDQWKRIVAADVEKSYKRGELEATEVYVINR